MYYGTNGFTQIAIAFIAVALLVVMVDQVTRVLQAIMVKIPFLPDQFEMPIAYLILVGLASAVCWQGDFDLFRLLGFSWRHHWQGWLITGAIMAGGSSLLGKQFKMVGLIPNMISGVASTFGWGGYDSADTDVIANADTTTTNSKPEQNQAGDL